MLISFVPPLLVSVYINEVMTEGYVMYAIHGKMWTKLTEVLNRYPLGVRFEHFMTSNRLWALLGMIVVVALVMAAVAMLVMFTMWVGSMDISTFDIRT